MADTRTHRSAGPADRELFSAARVPVLAEATAHLSWLRQNGYAERSALALVGDRFRLRQRQRNAVRSAAASDSEVRLREARRIALERMAGESLAIDAFNVLTTVEVALGGGAVLLARDGCARDLASQRGTWRRVEETLPALEALGRALEGVGVTETTWYVDAPVSNSGRLAASIERLARERGWAFEARTVADVDERLAGEAAVVASADRRVLDRCGRWVSLAREVVTRLEGAWIVDLQGERNVS